MTFSSAPWAIDGATTDAVLARLQLQSSTQGKSGIIGSGDLKVTALGTPGTSVTVASGAFVAAGVEASWQGSYYANNIGSVNVAVPASSSSPRSHLIVARVEDPTISGSPWSHNPATDPMVYLVLISDVTSGTTVMPSGQTGVPLARIDVPASTSIITQAMIHDLRLLVNPIVTTGFLCQNGSTDSQIDGFATTVWTAWPSWFSQNVSIPSWAKTMKVSVIWSQAKIKATGSGTEGGPVNGLRLKIGTVVSQEVFTNNLDMVSPQQSRRTVALADTVDVSALAGTTVAIVPQGISAPQAGHGTGESHMDNFSALIVQYEFDQTPS